MSCVCSSSSAQTLLLDQGLVLPLAGHNTEVHLGPQGYSAHKKAVLRALGFSAPFRLSYHRVAPSLYGFMVVLAMPEHEVCTALQYHMCRSKPTAQGHSPLWPL